MVETVRKGEMILNIVWDLKVNETKKYEQHLIAGYLPERVKQLGKRMVRLDKEWFFGQGEKEKKTGRWIQDSIRIIRVRANIPSDEAEKLLLHMGHIFLWFLANATRKTFALINDRFEIIALHGYGLGRTRILDEIAKLRSKYFNE